MRVCFLGVNSRSTFQHFESILFVFGVFVKQIVILNIVFGFVVLNSIWEHGSKHLFDILRNISKMSQKCEQFSYGTFGGIFLGFLVPLRVKDTSCISYFIVARNSLAHLHVYAYM